MTKRTRVERGLYAMLVALMIASLFLLFAQHNIQSVWLWYSHIYFSLLLIYTWFIFGLLFMADLKERNKPQTPLLYPEPRIGVIIPSFNEDPKLLYRSVRSVYKTRGDKIILIVDDGTTDIESKKLLKRFADNHIPVHFFETNKGKRHALHHAVKTLAGKVDIIVTIDSDTVLDKDAIVNLIKPFASMKVGATSGDVRLLNEKKNILTRMAASYYWIGLNIYKRAQSAVGMVVCCSGCLSAYRANILEDIIDEFVNQKFFGEPCTHSEDRHLTNLVLKGGWHVKFVREAVSYTESPPTLKGFLKQQQRWKRGYVRESIYTLTYAWKKRPLLFFEILLWELTVPYFAFGLMVGLIISVIANPSYFLTTILPAWLMFMVVRYIHIFFYAGRKIPGLLVYMLFYDLFLYWQSIYALFTVKNKSWITR